MNENQMIIILIMANIFVIGTFSFWIDLCNQKKLILARKNKLQSIQNQINEYKHKFEIAKSENAKIDTKLKSIEISKFKLRK